VLTLLFQQGTSRETLKRALFVTVVAVLPLIAWVIRNNVVADSLTGRSLDFHLIGAIAVNAFVDSLMHLLSAHALPAVVKVLVSIVGAGVVIGALSKGIRGHSSTDNRYIRFFSASMVSTYVVFLVAYNSFANPAVDLGPRVALPVYVFGIILIFSLIEWESAVGKLRTLFWCITVSAFLVVLGNLGPAVSWVSYRHREGEGFTSRNWKESETVQFVKALPSHVTVWSNAADACYLFTHREALRLPAKYDPTRARVNTEFAKQMTALRNKLNDGQTVVIYFDKVTWRDYLPNRSDLEGSDKLPVLRRFADGVVYGVPSETFQVIRP